MNGSESKNSQRGFDSRRLHMKDHSVLVALASTALWAALIVATLMLAACDNPTKWKDQEPACALDCELTNSQWFRTINGVEWEWLFKDGTFLAGRKGLVNPIVGSWKTTGNMLELADSACRDQNGMSIVGTYVAHIRGGTLEIGPFADACTPRLLALPGIWHGPPQTIETRLQESQVQDVWPNDG